MNTSEIRNEARKLAKFPFVEPALVDELIDRVDFYRVPGTATMICSIILKSGFTVVDHASCKDPRNFNEELAKRLSFSKARDQIFALEAYADVARGPIEAALPNIV